MAGSRAVSDREPGQVRKEAALSGPAHAPRTNLAGAEARRARPRTIHEDGCTVHIFRRMPEPKSQSSPFVQGAQVLLAIVALMWVLEIVDVALDHRLDNYGIEPRDPDALPGSSARRSCTPASGTWSATPSRWWSWAWRSRSRGRSGWSR